jgi:hypothetical protein
MLSKQSACAETAHLSSLLSLGSSAFICWQQARIFTVQVQLLLLVLCVQDAWVLLAVRSEGGDPQEQDASQEEEKQVAAAPNPGRKGIKPGRAVGRKRVKTK